MQDRHMIITRAHIYKHIEKIALSMSIYILYSVCQKYANIQVYRRRTRLRRARADQNQLQRPSW